METIAQLQIRHHLSKIATLFNELETRKNAGEKRIWESQLELERDLERLRNQIRSRELMIEGLKSK